MLEPEKRQDDANGFFRAFTRLMRVTSERQFSELLSDAVPLLGITGDCFAKERLLRDRLVTGERQFSELLSEAVPPAGREIASASKERWLRNDGSIVNKVC
jgi:hypothetical protein